jgi:hypothetical protein
MALTEQDQADLKRLVARLTKSGLSDSVAVTAIKELTAAIKMQEPPKITIENAPSASTEGKGRTWKFTHRYDEFHRLKETTATPV